MIWHNHMRAQVHLREMFRDGSPMFVGDLTHGGQVHYAIHDLAKQVFALTGHDRNEICARQGVIVSLQPDGMTMVLLRVKFHRSSFE